MEVEVIIYIYIYIYIGIVENANCGDACRLMTEFSLFCFQDLPEFDTEGLTLQDIIHRTQPSKKGIVITVVRILLFILESAF